MKVVKSCLALLAACVFAPAHAEDFAVGEFTIKIPASFQGPTSSQPMPRAQAQMFSIEPAAVPKPAILILGREGDGQTAALQPGEYVEAARKFAAEMLAST